MCQHTSMWRTGVGIGVWRGHVCQHRRIEGMCVSIGIYRGQVSA